MLKLDIILLFPLLISGSCKKTVDELSKLPTITQEGKKTFGCLVNGKAWTPENGNLILTTPPLRFYYDNTNGGQFSIRAERIISASNIDQSINMGVDSCTSAKTYTFKSNPAYPLRFAFNDYKNNSSSCITLFSSDNNVQTTGYITISRFDLSQGIISGTFEFTLTKSGCETVKVTNGRFDAKL
jgi:hypothetical protein